MTSQEQPSVRRTSVFADAAKYAIQKGAQTVESVMRDTRSTIEEATVAAQNVKDEAAQTVNAAKQLKQTATAPLNVPSNTEQKAYGGGKKSKSKPAKKTKQTKNSTRKDNEDISNQASILQDREKENLQSVYGEPDVVKPHEHSSNCGCSTCKDSIVIETGEEAELAHHVDAEPTQGGGKRRKSRVKKSKPKKSRSRSRRSKSKSKRK